VISTTPPRGTRAGAVKAPSPSMKPTVSSPPTTPSTAQSKTPGTLVVKSTVSPTPTVAGPSSVSGTAASWGAHAAATAAIRTARTIRCMWVMVILLGWPGDVTGTTSEAVRCGAAEDIPHPREGGEEPRDDGHAGGSARVPGLSLGRVGCARRAGHGVSRAKRRSNQAPERVDGGHRR
jgi:hypothetical protein